MSCCGGNCGCGSGCKCGNGCGGCKMHSDFSSGESGSETLIIGTAAQMRYFEGSEANAGSENGGCKCGSNCACGSSCTCAPCNCK